MAYVKGQMPSGVSGVKRKVSAKVEHLDRKEAVKLIDSLGRKAKGHYDFKLAYQHKMATIDNEMKALRDEIDKKQKLRDEYEKLEGKKQVETQVEQYRAAGFSSLPSDYTAPLSPEEFFVRLLSHRAQDQAVRLQGQRQLLDLRAGLSELYVIYHACISSLDFDLVYHVQNALDFVHILTGLQVWTNFLFK